MTRRARGANSAHAAQPLKFRALKGEPVVDLVHPNDVPRPPWLARLILSLFGVVLALGLAEVAARLVPSTDQFAGRMTVFRAAVLRPEPQTGWRAVAGAQVEVGGIAYRFDDLGCRGPMPRPQDPRPTLLIAGDSMAMGWGVAERQTFAGRLATARPDLQVRNAGMVGFNLGQDIARVAQLLPILRPKEVLLAYFANDAEARGDGREDWLAKSALWRRIQPPLWSLAAGIGLAADVTAYHEKLHAPHSPGWQRVTEGFGQFADLCVRSRVACTVVLIPELQKRPYGLSSLHERLAQLARADGLRVLDLAPTLAGLHPQDLWVMPDDAHPNAEAHRRFADFLLQHLSAEQP